MSDFTITTHPMQVTWDLLHPSAAQVRVRDIAWSLANGAIRFGGHIRGGYSVAQHSVLTHDLLAGVRGWPDDVAFAELSHDLCCEFNEARRWSHEGDPETQLAKDAGLHVLFHDGHEGYLGDLTGPIKKLLRHLGAPFGMQSPWDWLEERHDEAILDALGLRAYWAGDHLPKGATTRVRRFAQVVHMADKEAYRIESKALRSYGRPEDVEKLPGGRILNAVEAANLFLHRARLYGIDDCLGDFHVDTSDPRMPVPLEKENP